MFATPRIWYHSNGGNQVRPLIKLQDFNFIPKQAHGTYLHSTSPS